MKLSESMQGVIESESMQDFIESLPPLKKGTRVLVLLMSLLTTGCLEDENPNRQDPFPDTDKGEGTTINFEHDQPSLYELLARENE